MSFSVLPQVKLSELPAASTLTGTEKIPVVQGSTTARTTAALLRAYTLTGLLDDIDALSDPGADRVIAWDDSAGALVYLSAADFKAAYSFGSMADQSASSVAITGGTITGITDLAIADGGTGASTAEAAIEALFDGWNYVPGNVLASPPTLSSYIIKRDVKISGFTLNATGSIQGNATIALDKPATSTLTVTGNAGIGETLTIGSDTVTFVAAGPLAADEVLYDALDTAEDVVDKIIGNLQTRTSVVKITEATSTTILASALAHGTAGDGIATTETMANASWSSATTTGGADDIFNVDSDGTVTNATIDGDDNTLQDIPGTAVDAASDTVRGTVELATDAETQTGTDTARAIPPSALSAWWAWIKTQAATFSAAISFTDDVDFTGANITGMDLSTITLGQVNIGTSDYGWTYNPAVNDGQMEIRFPGGTAAFYETGDPAAPYFYLPGTIEADALIGNITSSNITASGLVGAINTSVMEASLTTNAHAIMPTVTGMGASGIPYSDQTFGYGPSAQVGTPYFLISEVKQGALIKEGELKYYSASDIHAKLSPSTVAALDYPSIAAGGEATLTVTVIDPNYEMFTPDNPTVNLGWSAALPAGIVVKQAWVSGAATVSITLANITAGAIDPPSITVRAAVSQY